MNKNNKKIKFEVIPHFSDNIQLKDLLKNLIIREIDDRNKKVACSK